MHIERTSLEDLIEVVTLSFEPSDYAPRVERVLENYRKQAVIPGFRKGKAPMALVRKQYAAPVLADEMNKMIQEHLDAFIRDNGLQVLGQPLLWNHLVGFSIVFLGVLVVLGGPFPSEIFHVAPSIEHMRLANVTDSSAVSHATAAQGTELTPSLPPAPLPPR